MPDRLLFGVAGRPIAHSLSPAIFRALFRESGLKADYIRLAALDAADVFALADALGLAGVNVTAPFKEAVNALLDVRDTAAARIGAVNCLVRKGRVWQGANTDHAGAVGALEDSGVRVRNAQVVVLGAGGAARAAAFGLLRRGAARVVLAGRSGAKGSAAAASLGCDFVPLRDLGRILPRCGLLISAVPAGAALLPLGESRADLVILDADYATGSFARLALRRGRIIDGRAWLLKQALLAFVLFTGRRPPRSLRHWPADIPDAPRRPGRKHVALIGFMGAGKSAVGRILAERLGRSCIDTDAAVEAAAGRTIPEIFRIEGETAFRALEKAAIRAAVAAVRPAVLSLGGGAVLDPENVRRLRSDCRMAWLWASPAVVSARVSASPRPRLGPAPTAGETAALLARRMPSYIEACDFVVNADAAPPAAVAGRIIDEMR